MIHNWSQEEQIHTFQRRGTLDGEQGHTLSTLQTAYRQQSDRLFMVRGVPCKSVVEGHGLDAGLPGG